MSKLQFSTGGIAIVATRYKPGWIVRECLDSVAPFVDGVIVWVNNPEYEDACHVVEHHPSVVFSWEEYGCKPLHHARFRNVLLQRARSICACNDYEPKYIVFIDDDEAFPQANGFPEFFWSWVNSDSELLLFRLMRFWNDKNTIRVDNKVRVSPHAKVVKYSDELMWTSSCTPTNQRSIPRDKRKWQKSPWPLRHYRTVTDEERQTYRKMKGVDNLPDNELPPAIRRGINGAVFAPYDPEITTAEFVQTIRAVKAGSIPAHCWTGEKHV